jgi:hypothetical protein
VSSMIFAGSWKNVGIDVFGCCCYSWKKVGIIPICLTIR